MRLIFWGPTNDALRFTRGVKPPPSKELTTTAESATTTTTTTTAPPAYATSTTTTTTTTTTTSGAPLDPDAPPPLPPPADAVVDPLLPRDPAPDPNPDPLQKEEEEEEPTVDLLESLAGGPRIVPKEEESNDDESNDDKRRKNEIRNGPPVFRLFAGSPGETLLKQPDSVQVIYRRESNNLSDLRHTFFSIGLHSENASDEDENEDEDAHSDVENFKRPMPNLFKMLPRSDFKWAVSPIYNKNRNGSRVGSTVGYETVEGSHLDRTYDRWNLDKAYQLNVKVYSRTTRKYSWKPYFSWLMYNTFIVHDGSVPASFVRNLKSENEDGEDADAKNRVRNGPYQVPGATTDDDVSLYAGIYTTPKECLSRLTHQVLDSGEFFGSLSMIGTFIDFVDEKGEYLFRRCFRTFLMGKMLEIREGNKEKAFRGRSEMHDRDDFAVFLKDVIYPILSGMSDDEMGEEEEEEEEEGEELDERVKEVPSASGIMFKEAMLSGYIGAGIANGMRAFTHSNDPFSNSKNSTASVDGDGNLFSAVMAYLSTMNVSPPPPPSVNPMMIAYEERELTTGSFDNFVWRTWSTLCKGSAFENKWDPNGMVLDSDVKILGEDGERLNPNDKTLYEDRLIRVHSTAGNVLYGEIQNQPERTTLREFTVDLGIPDYILYAGGLTCRDLDNFTLSPAVAARSKLDYSKLLNARAALTCLMIKSLPDIVRGFWTSFKGPYFDYLQSKYCTLFKDEPNRSPPFVELNVRERIFGITSGLKYIRSQRAKFGSLPPPPSSSSSSYSDGDRGRNWNWYVSVYRREEKGGPSEAFARTVEVTYSTDSNTPSFGEKRVISSLPTTLDASELLSYGSGFDRYVCEDDGSKEGSFLVWCKSATHPEVSLSALAGGAASRIKILDSEGNRRGRGRTTGLNLTNGFVALGTRLDLVYDSVESGGECDFYLWSVSKTKIRFPSSPIVSSFDTSSYYSLFPKKLLLKLTVKVPKDERTVSLSRRMPSKTLRKTLQLTEGKDCVSNVKGPDGKDMLANGGRRVVWDDGRDHLYLDDDSTRIYLEKGDDKDGSRASSSAVAVVCADVESYARDDGEYLAELEISGVDVMVDSLVRLYKKDITQNVKRPDPTDKEILVLIAELLENEVGKQYEDAKKAMKPIVAAVDANAIEGRFQNEVDVTYRTALRKKKTIKYPPEEFSRNEFKIIKYMLARCFRLTSRYRGDRSQWDGFFKLKCLSCLFVADLFSTHLKDKKRTDDVDDDDVRWTGMFLERDISKCLKEAAKEGRSVYPRWKWTWNPKNMIPFVKNVLLREHPSLSTIFEDYEEELASGNEDFFERYGNRLFSVLMQRFRDNASKWFPIMSSLISVSRKEADAYFFGSLSSNSFVRYDKDGDEPNVPERPRRIKKAKNVKDEDEEEEEEEVVFDFAGYELGEGIPVGIPREILNAEFREYISDFLRKMGSMRKDVQGIYKNIEAVSSEVVLSKLVSNSRPADGLSVLKRVKKRDEDWKNIVNKLNPMVTKWKDDASDVAYGLKTLAEEEEGKRDVVILLKKLREGTGDFEETKAASDISREQLDKLRTEIYGDGGDKGSEKDKERSLTPDEIDRLEDAQYEHEKVEKKVKDVEDGLGEILQEIKDTIEQVYRRAENEEKAIQDFPEPIAVLNDQYPDFVAELMNDIDNLNNEILREKEEKKEADAAARLAEIESREKRARERAEKEAKEAEEAKKRREVKRDKDKIEEEKKKAAQGGASKKGASGKEPPFVRANEKPVAPATTPNEKGIIPKDLPSDVLVGAEVIPKDTVFGQFRDLISDKFQIEGFESRDLRESIFEALSNPVKWLGEGKRGLGKPVGESSDLRHRVVLLELLWVYEKIYPLSTSDTIDPKAGLGARKKAEPNAYTPLLTQEIAKEALLKASTLTVVKPDVGKPDVGSKPIAPKNTGNLTAFLLEKTETNSSYIKLLRKEDISADAVVARYRPEDVPLLMKPIDISYGFGRLWNGPNDSDFRAMKKLSNDTSSITRNATWWITGAPVANKKGGSVRKEKYLELKDWMDDAAKWSESEYPTLGNGATNAWLIVTGFVSGALLPLLGTFSTEVPQKGKPVGFGRLHDSAHPINSVTSESYVTKALFDEMRMQRVFAPYDDDDDDDGPSKSAKVTTLKSDPKMARFVAIQRLKYKLYLIISKSTKTLLTLSKPVLGKHHFFFLVWCVQNLLKDLMDGGYELISNDSDVDAIYRRFKVAASMALTYLITFSNVVCFDYARNYEEDTVVGDTRDFGTVPFADAYLELGMDAYASNKNDIELFKNSLSRLKASLRELISIGNEATPKTFPSRYDKKNFNRGSNGEEIKATLENRIILAFQWFYGITLANFELFASIWELFRLVLGGKMTESEKSFNKYQGVSYLSEIPKGTTYYTAIYEFLGDITKSKHWQAMHDTGDGRYYKALDDIWANMVRRKPELRESFGTAPDYSVTEEDWNRAFDELIGMSNLRKKDELFEKKPYLGAFDGLFEDLSLSYSEIFQATVLSEDVRWRLSGSLRTTFWMGDVPLLAVLTREFLSPPSGPKVDDLVSETNTLQRIFIFSIKAAQQEMANFHFLETGLSKARANEKGKNSDIPLYVYEGAKLGGTDYVKGSSEEQDKTPGGRATRLFRTEILGGLKPARLSVANDILNRTILVDDGIYYTSTPKINWEGLLFDSNETTKPAKCPLLSYAGGKFNIPLVEPSEYVQSTQSRLDYIRSHIPDANVEKLYWSEFDRSYYDFRVSLVKDMLSCLYEYDVKGSAFKGASVSRRGQFQSWLTDDDVVDYMTSTVGNAFASAEQEKRRGDIDFFIGAQDDDDDGSQDTGGAGFSSENDNEDDDDDNDDDGRQEGSSESVEETVTEGAKPPYTSDANDAEDFWMTVSLLEHLDPEWMLHAASEDILPKRRIANVSWNVKVKEVDVRTGKEYDPSKNVRGSFVRKIAPARPPFHSTKDILPRIDDHSKSFSSLIDDSITIRRMLMNGVEYAQRPLLYRLLKLLYENSSFVPPYTGGSAVLSEHEAHHIFGPLKGERRARWGSSRLTESQTDVLRNLISSIMGFVEYAQRDDAYGRSEFDPLDLRRYISLEEDFPSPFKLHRLYQEFDARRFAITKFTPIESGRSNGSIVRSETVTGVELLVRYCGQGDAAKEKRDRLFPPGSHLREQLLQSFNAVLSSHPHYAFLFYYGSYLSARRNRIEKSRNFRLSLGGEWARRAGVVAPWMPADEERVKTKCNAKYFDKTKGDLRLSFDLHQTLESVYTCTEDGVRYDFELPYPAPSWLVERMRSDYPYLFESTCNLSFYYTNDPTELAGLRVGGEGGFTSFQHASLVDAGSFTWGYGRWGTFVLSLRGNEMNSIQPIREYLGMVSLTDGISDDYEKNALLPTTDGDAGRHNKTKINPKNQNYVLSAQKRAIEKLNTDLLPAVVVGKYQGPSLAASTSQAFPDAIDARDVLIPYRALDGVEEVVDLFYAIKRTKEEEEEEEKEGKKGTSTYELKEMFDAAWKAVEVKKGNGDGISNASDADVFVDFK